MKFLQDGMIYMNLNSELTVFLISSEEETKKDCIEALRKQTIKFNLLEIENIYPMSLAFSQMHLRCKTKYFVQVDSDMILYPNAIEKLYLSIKKTFFFTYRVSAPLYEIGFGKGGMVKCWKKNIFNFFDFRDVRTVDRDFEKRVKIFGFRKKTINEILGKHIPRHSNKSSFIKSKADVEKWKFLKRKFNKYCGPKLREIISKKRINYYELYGSLFGIIGSKENLIKSKNIYKENIIYNEFSKIFNLNSIYDDKITKIVIDNFDLISQVYNDFEFKNKNNLIRLTKIIVKGSILKKNINNESLINYIIK